MPKKRCAPFSIQDAVQAEVGSLRRLYYHCRHCGRGAVPGDRALDIEGTQYSPGGRRLLAVVGGETPFARGRELLALIDRRL